MKSISRWKPDQFSPARHLSSCQPRLDGFVDNETSDGEVRQVAAGGFVLVEDTHGKGHISRHST
jgi:hypothetical protein